MATRRLAVVPASITLALSLFLLAGLAAPAAGSVGTWTQTGPAGDVVALTVGPEDPGVIYSSVVEQGILRSSDGGATWVSLAGPFACFEFPFDLSQLAANPQQPGKVYAGTSLGLFETMDGGATWQQVLASNQGLGAVLDFDLVAGSPEHLFALVDLIRVPFDPAPPCLSSGFSGLTQSADGGASWTDLAIGGGPLSGLAADPANPARIFIGALSSPRILDIGDGGVTRSLPDLPTPPFPGGLVLRIDPTTTPSTLFVMVKGLSGGIYRAVPPPAGNAAPFWTQAAAGLPAGATLSDLLLDPNVPGRLYAATSAGVFVSNDRGDSWTVEGAGLASTAVTTLAIDGRPLGPLYAGTLSGGVYALDRGGCADADAASCLNGFRFKVEASFQLANGQTGVGHALALTGDTSAFWFFDPANLELLVKVLDGRAVNGDFWVFAGSLSDVGYTLTVTDILTGKVQTYSNPAGSLSSFADTAAFPAAGAPSSESPTFAPPAASAAAACAAGTANLCLAASRFEVQVAFQAGGISGAGHAVSLTDDTGAFWFLGADNLELAVKVLDGRAVNGHFWVFYGALSDDHYVITVTDTATGAVKTYVNAAGHLASFADTAAF